MSLLDDVRLTDEEIREALGHWPPSRHSSQPDYLCVADAQLGKVLWTTAEWLKKSPHAVVQWEGSNLAGMLHLAGIPRPKEVPHD